MSFNFEKEKKEIIEKLEKMGYVGRSLTYYEILELYKPYNSKMPEATFIEILGIKNSNYQRIKNGTGKAKILKPTFAPVEKERKTQIKEEITKRKELIGKSIDYTEFLELYKPYKEEISEQDFAEILEIKQTNYKSMKNKGVKTVALKKEFEPLTEERKEEIKQEVIKRYSLSNSNISYSNFLRLYEPYKREMSEQDFAEILGIKHTNYETMKNRNIMTEILKKEYRELSQEEVEEIRKKLTTKGLAFGAIDYQEFLLMYGKYKERMSEQNFAKILGISNASYLSIKHNIHRRATINFDKELNDRIRFHFQEGGLYTIAYFEEIQARYDCTLEQIMKAIYGNDVMCELMTQALQEKENLYIGTKRIGKEVFTRHAEGLSKEVHEYSLNVGKKLHTVCYCEDIAQDILIQSMDRGELIENLGEEKGFEILKRWCRVGIKHEHLR